MATTPPRLTLPITVGTAQVGTVEVDLEVSAEHSGQTVTIKTNGNVDQAIAQGMVEAAERLAPGITSPTRIMSGLDQPLQWPTTPGSAVLADRKNGAGPQVLILAKANGMEQWRWWGGFDTPYDDPRDWTHSRASSIYDLLQVLYVAP